MHINNIFIRFVVLFLLAFFALGIFMLIVWRWSIAFWIVLKTRSLVFVSLFLIGVLIAGMFLSITSSTHFVEIIWLVLIGCIYILWFVSPLLIVKDIVSFWYKLSPMIMIILTWICLLLGVYYGTFHIKITPLTIASERIHKEYKIVFISDLHVEAIHNRWYIQSIVDRINMLHPDFVLIGGDLMNIWKTSYIDALLPLHQIKVPVYATLGNHDYMWNSGALLDIANKTHVILLRNQSIALDWLQIVGIDDKSYRWNKKLSEILQESNISDQNQFTLLISHQPQKLDKLVWYPIDLELAWHTHNGQFFPLSLLMSLFNDYAYGKYSAHGMTAFVSQWIGSWWAPLRLWTQRELVLITLQPK